MTHSESIKDITSALAKAQLAFKPIKKTEDVDYQTAKGRKKYSYAPLAEVIEATKQGLADNGLAVIQSTKLVDGNVILETLLAHSSGEWLSSEFYVGKFDEPPQDEGSALTYKRRYGLSAILNVSSEDDDDGKTAQEKAGDKPIAAPISPPVDKTQHWCSEHNTAFFMRGKMKSFAHPIEGSKEWCYEHKHSPAEQDIQDLWPEGETSLTTLKGPTVDTDWVKESVDHLQWADFAKWVSETYHVTGKTVREMIANLNVVQSNDLVKEINRRLAEAH